MNLEIIYSTTTDTLTFIMIDSRADRRTVAREIHPILKVAFGNSLGETMITVGRIISQRAYTINTWSRDLVRGDNYGDQGKGSRESVHETVSHSGRVEDRLE